MDTDNSTVELVDPVKQFADLLRRLQVDSGGPSVRDLERLTEKLGTPYTRGTIQDKLTGRSAAAWEFVEAFVRACALHAGSGEPDLHPWRASHSRMARAMAAARAGRRRPSRLEVCPYRGLETFTAEHAEWFHGRAVAVQCVLAGLAAHRPGVLLLGPSGAGKSSLIRAGVLPALANGQLPGSDQWIPVVAGPGGDLSGALDRVELPDPATTGDRPVGQRFLVVVDQFEELLTPSASPEQDHAQHELLDRLTGMIGSPGRTVVLIMRDDFYPRLAARAPALLQALTPGLVNAPATLSMQDLHDIITRPAEAVGVAYDDGLAERIVTDVLATDPDAARTRQAPTTVLPLLELTLQQMWQRRGDGCLTHEAYQRVGGVAGGLTAWCDTVMDQLPPARQHIARRLLTALVRPADEIHGVPAVRQQMPLATLRELADAAEPAAADEVLAVLTAHRVVTTRTAPRSHDRDGVAVAELVHDALIRDWGTLRGWVDQDHRFQDWLRRAGERQARWVAHRDSGDLLHGTDLAEGLEWAAQRRLPEGAEAFLAASRRSQLARIRSARRLAAVLATLLVVAIGATGVALWQRQTATAAQRVGLSRQLAAQSSADLDVDFDLAALLSVQAYRTSPTTEALNSLYAAAARPLRAVFTGHTNVVDSVAFSPDGGTLATASVDGTVRLWDAATGRVRHILTGSERGMSSVAFSPDGRTLATASVDGTVRVWDAASGDARKTLTGRSNAVYAVAFSPDGDILAAGGVDGTVRLWNVAGGRLRATLRGHPDPVYSLAFSPDGRTLAAGSGDHTARLWQVAGGRLRATLTGHTGAVESVAFSPEGGTLATASVDGVVRLWDVASGRGRSALTGHTADVFSVAFSPDGRSLASGSDDGTVRLWNLASGQTRTTLTGHIGAVFSVGFSPDGSTLASGSDDGSVRLWAVVSGQPRTTLTGHIGAVFSAAFSPDASTLASGSSDGTVRLWDVPSGQPRTTLTGHAGAVFSVAFSPDGSTLATGSNDGALRLWDVASGRARTIRIRQSDPVASVAFSPDGSTVVTGGSDGVVRLWDVASGRSRATLTGHVGDVFSVAFSPDGRVLATGGADRTVRLWEVAGGRSRAILTGGTGAVFSVAFSPDGRTLATGGADHTIRLWDVPSGQIRVVLTGHTDVVYAVAFSPDGRTLATGGADRTVRLWDVALPTPAAAIDKICRAVHRNLTTQERTIYLPGQPRTAICG